LVRFEFNCNTAENIDRFDKGVHWYERFLDGEIFAIQSSIKTARMEKFSIAIVDDDPDDLGFINTALENTSPAYKAITFQTAEAFYTFLESATELPLLVILDYNMPVTNGEDILIYIKQNERLAPMKVVFLSTGMTVSLRERLMGLGAYTCISKPTSAEAYRRLANSIIQISEELSKGESPSFPGVS